MSGKLAYLHIWNVFLSSVEPEYILSVSPLKASLLWAVTTFVPISWIRHPCFSRKVMSSVISRVNVCEPSCPTRKYAQRTQKMKEKKGALYNSHHFSDAVTSSHRLSSFLKTQSFQSRMCTDAFIFGWWFLYLQVQNRPRCHFLLRI